jgi:hemolysin activation/secretion protein
MRKSTGFFRGVLALIFLFLGSYDMHCAEIPTASQIERSRELLEKEKSLRNELEKNNKVFIKKITLKGATALSKDQIREIILPFQRRWLSRQDIQQILDLIARAYQRAGYTGKPPQASFQLKKNNLEIQIKESPVPAEGRGTRPLN